MSNIIKGNVALKRIDMQKLNDMLREYYEKSYSLSKGYVPTPYIICGPETYNIIGNLPFAKYHAKVLVDYTMTPFGQIEIR